MARSTSRSSRRPSRLVIAALTIVAGVAMLAIGVQAQPTGGRYAQIAGAINCARELTWNVTLPAVSETGPSSNGRAPSQIGHNNVVIQYRVNTNRWVDLDTVELDRDNQFSASGTLDLNSIGTAEQSPNDTEGDLVVDLQVTPEGPWADGSSSSQPRFAQIRVPDHCHTHPVDVEAQPACTNNAVALHLHHVGDLPTATIPLSLYLDGAPLRNTSISAQEELVFNLPMQPAFARHLVVEAKDGTTLYDGQIRLDCSDSAAVISPVVMVEFCQQSRGEFVFARSGEYQLLLDGTVVQVVTVAEPTKEVNDDLTQPLQRTSVELPEDRQGTFLEVVLDNTVVLSGMLDGCNSLSLGLSTVVESLETPVGDGEIMPVPPPPVDTQEPLPETGLSTLGATAILSGLLLLAGGIWAFLVELRKPRSELLALAIAPYKKTWWIDDEAKP